jgi:hypothetical protein
VSVAQSIVQNFRDLSVSSTFSSRSSNSSGSADTSERRTPGDRYKRRADIPGADHACPARGSRINAGCRGFNRIVNKGLCMCSNSPCTSLNAFRSFRNSTR